MIQTCCYCDKNFESDIIDYFCCEDHQRLYWTNPIKLTIASKCPRCNVIFKREIYSIELCPYQSFICCKECSSLFWTV